MDRTHSREDWPTKEHDLLTPDEVGRELRVSGEQVRSLIRAGSLAAINVGTGSKRPLYRITPKAVEEFLSRRFQSGDAVRPRKARRRSPVPDFFPDLS